MSRARTLCLLPVLLLAVAGCSTTHHVTQPVADGAPDASSPTEAVRLFQWCWNNRDLARYGEVFAQDFVFVFAAGDSSGNPYRDDPFDRDDMLACARHLFVGDGTASPASSISLVLDATLVPGDDSRPGKDPRWHREIPSSVSLRVETVEGGRYVVTGNATFFVVRGDSATIPPDLGFAPDSTRWYVERWEDGTISGVTARAALASVPQPSTNPTWGSLLALYRQQRAPSPDLVVAERRHRTRDSLPGARRRVSGFVGGIEDRRFGPFRGLPGPTWRGGPCPVYYAAACVRPVTR